MKYFLSLIVSFSILCTSVSAVEYGTLVAEEVGMYQIASEKVILNDGDQLEIIGALYDASGYNLYLKDVRMPSSIIVNQNDELSNTRETHIKNNTASWDHCFVGPAELFIVQTQSSPGRDFLRVSYKLTRASEVEYKQTNIVSLPSSTVGAGTHEIVVEASDDQQTWTPVHSSSIGGNKAFFRTRVVEAGD